MDLLVMGYILMVLENQKGGTCFYSHFKKKMLFRIRNHTDI